jgi:hypothetical protein
MGWDMSSGTDRRNFLKTSAVLAAAAGAKGALGAEADGSGTPREYYELRVYRAPDAEKKTRVDRYLETALVPALGRLGLDRVGVFANEDDPDDHSLYVVVPYPTLDRLAAVNPTLLADETYQAAAREHFAVPQEDPAFTRIQSRLYKAFAGMPVIEMPEETARNLPRVFELRIYESHTEEKAALKVDMFNSGEIQVMRDTGLGPVFFGEALIGGDLPNLAYMLSAADRDAHAAHWKAFGEHPEWNRMKALPRYEDTVSSITNTFLAPTAYSGI